MIRQRLKRFIDQRKTLLGVGPMSVNCVDAAIELANDHEIPIMLIASRRQIDSEEFGGGYVNHWTTREFADYVIDHDKKGWTILARDHGGPWQNNMEITESFSLRRAMESAKSSYKSDLEAGFQILHIDPSVDIYGNPSVDDVLDRVCELYEYCWSTAQQIGQEVLFEIGTEEQSGSTNTSEELEYTLAYMKKYCERQKLPFPCFIVIQTGTRVMETRNVGSFDAPVRVADEIPAEIQVPKMIEVCNQYDIFMKEHNTDYLSNEALQWHPRLGIHSANVAPEYGVAETLMLLHLLESNGMSSQADQFLQLAYDSGKWKKWMLPDTDATDRDRSVIAGHYVFAHEDCKRIKKDAENKLSAQGIELEPALRQAVKESILRYLTNFRLVQPQ